MPDENHVTFLCEGCRQRFPASALYQRTWSGRWFTLHARLATGEWHGTSARHLVYAMVCSATCLRQVPQRTAADWRMQFQGALS